MKIYHLLIITLFFIGCAEKKCSNEKQDKKETGIDCGGDCKPCETCSDGIKNQDEVDIDCGGLCAACLPEYPASGNFGTNILTNSVNDDTLNLTHLVYSMRAERPQGTTLKIKLKSVVGGSWWYSSNSGWSISPFNAGEQDFESTSQISDVDIDLTSVSGTFQIWYYENSETVNRVTTVYVN